MNLDFETLNRSDLAGREQNSREDDSIVRGAMNASRLMSSSALSAAVANRTHRVVRERAVIMRARRNKVRSLWIPLAVCASLLIAVCFAGWNILDQYEVAPSGIPDASQQLLVLMLWSLPLSAALMALFWFKRSGAQAENDGRNVR
jgi:hypothetical protein